MSDRVLNAREIESLLAKRGARVSPPHGVTVAGKSDSSDPLLSGLSALHQEFADNLGASLSALLRSPVASHLARVERLTCRRFVEGLESPHCTIVLAAPPLSAGCCW